MSTEDFWPELHVQTLIKHNSDPVEVLITAEGSGHLHVRLNGRLIHEGNPAQSAR